MFKTHFSQKRELIIREILDKYHFDTGVSITGDRFFIVHRPERLAQLHYEFGCLATAYVPPEQEKDYMRRLKQVRKSLKNYYKKMKRSN